MIKAIWKKWPFLFKFRFVLGLILLIIIFVFLYLKVVPFGKVTYSRDYTASFGSGKGFINGFTPLERVDFKSGDVPKLVGDPVYFSLFTPRTFDKAKITIIYKDNLSIDTPIIEAGVLADNIVWRYDLTPIDNKALDYLMLRWSLIEENGTIFLQKEKKYNTLSEFENDLGRGELKACPEGLEECLAIYNYESNYKYRIPNYKPALPLIIDKPLRGTHQFYVYLDKEPLRLDFSFVDLNQSLKPSPIEVIVSSDKGIIMSKSASDNKANLGDSKIEEKNLVLEKNNLPTGVYKVEVKITDDMVIKKIVSSLDRLAFINKIYPVSNNGGLNIYTDASNLQVKALNPASLQGINFGGKDFVLDETYKQFNFELKDDSKSKLIKIAKDDIVLENNGVFSFSEASLFNPSLQKADRYFSVKTLANYVVANYKKPSEADGFKTANFELNLKGAYRENGKYSFMISVPGLKSDDNIKDNLEIYKIKIELEGRTIWQKIWK
ncbi:MAG: hypothetical protein ACOYL8_02135 [Patescibacteria group bacterium]